MLWLLALGMGVVFAAPVGPVGLMAAVRAGQGWWRNAWAIALGAALADAVLAMLAVAGMHVFRFVGDGAREAISGSEPWVAGGVALVMVAMARSLWQAGDVVELDAKPLIGFAIGFLATVAHPGNIAAFAGGYAWVSAFYGVEIEGFLGILMYGSGILAGAALVWGGFLLSLHALLRRHDVRQSFGMFRKLVALLLIASAVAVVVLGISGR